MSELDDRLTAALRADAPAERDVMFRVEVLMRLERARFRRRLILTMAAAFVAAVLLAVNAPTIAAWMAMDLQRVWIVALGASTALFALAGMSVEAPYGPTLLVRALGRWLYP